MKLKILLALLLWVLPIILIDHTKSLIVFVHCYVLYFTFTFCFKCYSQQILEKISMLIVSIMDVFSAEFLFQMQEYHWQSTNQTFPYTITSHVPEFPKFSLSDLLRFFFYKFPTRGFSTWRHNSEVEHSAGNGELACPTCLI